MRKKKARRALVIGANGFVGGAIVAALEQRDYSVRSEGQIQAGDLVIDAAAPAPLGLIADERAAITRLTDLLRRVRRHNATFAYVSSFTTLAREETLGSRWRRAMFPYFRIKETLERMALAAPRTVVVNPTACLGPGERDPDRSFVAMVLRQRLPAVMDQIINVIDVRDVAEAVSVAVQQEMFGKPISLSGHNVRLFDLANWVARVGDVPAPAFTVDARFAQAAAFLVGIAGIPTPSAFHAIPLIADSHAMPISSEQRALGVEPRPLEATLRDAVRWHQRECRWTVAGPTYHTSSHDSANGNRRSSSGPAELR